MKYKLKKDNYKQFAIYEQNKLAARSYFIPHSTKEEAKSSDFLTERFHSDSVRMLSGTWNFKYYKSCKQLPATFDTKTEQFDTISVPSTWQRTGYENPCYLNSRYEFPLNPPKIPSDMSAGVYQKNFDIDDAEQVYLINFLGVCSCFDLFVNGTYVGYSEGSHNTAEFELSPFIKAGQNELVAVVYKWCNGSYLECQDMFRENGIFRDVFIVKQPNSYLYDYEAKTTFCADGSYNLAVDVTVMNAKAGQKIALELVAPDGTVMLSDVCTDFTKGLQYTALSVQEWSCEIPNLYTIYLTFMEGDKETSTLRDFVGFKHIEIKENIFYFNNKKIKLFGINHHESHPVNGYVMGAQELEQDVKNIKAFNCNTVRLSHYPHDPLFLLLCDKYGLYSIDEMDIECHGVYSNPISPRYGLISNNLAWEGHFIDRAKRMFQKDKNRVSVTMWSLGNEAGGYQCHDKCNDYFKSVTNIPVHYENAIHTKRFCYDVVGEFYPAVSHVEEIGTNQIKDKRFTAKPYFMSEYAHAMGVGPGELSGYANTVLAHDNLLGGCIWEYCDHAVQAKNANYKYTYGGDHGEKKHDKNFCVDGMFFPDRSPSTGALNMRECYRPLRAVQFAKDSYAFTNTYRFIDTTDIKISWQILKNGLPVETGVLYPSIAPNATKTMQVPFTTKIETKTDFTMDFIYQSIKGDYIAREQFTLAAAQFPVSSHVKVKPSYKIESKVLTANVTAGTVQVNLKTGELVSYKINKVELIQLNPLLGRKGFIPNMRRGGIDNDMFIKILWNVLGLLLAKASHRSSKVLKGDKLQIESKYAIMGLGKLASCTTVLTINSDGHLDVTATLKRGLKLLAYSDITRFGVTLELPKSFDNIAYYGLGERETLSDFNEHGFLGEYRLKVNEMHEHYIKPQESGNRSEVRWAKITNAKGEGIKIVHQGQYLNFNANHYTYNTLSKAKHIEDLKEENTTNVQIDGFVRGAGSQSCGHQPVPRSIVNLKKPLTFAFSVFPVQTNNRMK